MREIHCFICSSYPFSITCLHERTSLWNMFYFCLINYSAINLVCVWYGRVKNCIKTGQTVKKKREVKNDENNVQLLFMEIFCPYSFEIYKRTCLANKHLLLASSYFSDRSTYYNVLIKWSSLEYLKTFLVCLA